MRARAIIGLLRRERLVAGLMAASLLLWIVHSGTHIQRKVPVDDEVDFVLEQENFYLTGVPTLQRDPTEATRVATWHPPMWWLIGQVFMHLGLPAMAATLATNLLGAVVTLASTFYLAWVVARRRRSPSPGKVAMLSVALLGALPLFQAGSGIIDIDNALLAGVMTAYLAILFGLCESPSTLEIAGLGVVIGAAWFTKISTPLILVPLTMILFRLRAPGWRTALTRTSIVVGTGAVTFLAAYAASRPFFAGNWVGPFGHSARRFTEMHHGFDVVMSLRTMAELFVWIGIPALGVVLLIGVLLTERIYRRRSQDNERMLLFLFTLGIWATYAYLGVTFNLRYMIPSLGAFAVVAALFVDEHVMPLVERSSLSRRSWLAGSAIIGLTLVLLPDPYLYLKTRMREDLLGSLVWYLGALGIIAGVVGVAVWRCARHRGAGTVGALASSLVALWLVFNLNTSVKQVAGGYQLSYAYGYTEFDGVTAWLLTSVRPDEPVFASETFIWLLRNSPLQVYQERSVERVRQRRPTGNAAAYYVVVPVRYARGVQEAWVKVTMKGAERVYENRDFAVVRKHF